MEKKLYIIATPIGNISEISNLAIKTLSENDYFFCEDTRITKKLFNLLKISLKNKEFISLNSFNEKNVIDKFKFNQTNYCLLSDAGYPNLSDPGYLLINYFIKQKWNISVINGPSALMHSLIISGFSTKQVLFVGFAKNTTKQNEVFFNDLSLEHKTLVLFVANNKLRKTLILLSKYFDTNTNICVCKELSKKNETIYRFTLKDMNVDQINYLGEFVLVINNNLKKDNKKNDIKITQLHNKEISKLIKQNEDLKTACKMVAYKYELKTKTLYNNFVNFYQKDK